MSTHLRFLRPSFVLLAITVAAACHDSSSGGGGSTETASFDATVAKRWFDQLTAAIDAENLNPPEASRRIGYAGVTFYEAVVGGMDEHRSLAGQLNGLSSLPELSAGRQHWPALANAAMADVLTALFPGASAPTLQAITDLEAELQAEFEADVDATTLDRSNQDGAALATAILAWAAEDGYDLWNDCAFTAPTGPGMWTPTPPGFGAPLEPCWGNLRPFVLLFGAECAPLPHPTYSLTPGSAFAVEAQEVYDVGNNLTVDQEEIATFWADGGGTLTPPGHWVSITGQVLAQEAKTLDVAAEAYAKVGIAVADAFISCWEIKFTYHLLRPITYIQDPAGPINDPGWTSFIGTPPFAEFSSGHSTQSGASAELLTDLLGPVAFTDVTHPALPARAFTSFTHAAEEAAISRLYGGIHYRAAIERGIEQGRCIARTILRNVEFRE